jgi:pilus assembly protein CpaF
MRLESMVAMAHLDLALEFTRRYIASAIDIVIQTARLADGTRKVTSIQEITGMEGPMITMQEIFSFRQMGVDKDGKVKGHYQFHGVRPRFLDKFVAMGIGVPRDIFNSDKIIEV